MWTGRGDPRGNTRAYDQILLVLYTHPQVHTQHLNTLVTPADLDAIRTAIQQPLTENQNHTQTRDDPDFLQRLDLVLAIAFNPQTGERPCPGISGLTPGSKR